MGKRVLVALLFAMLAAFSPMATSGADAQPAAVLEGGGGSAGAGDSEWGIDLDGIDLTWLCARLAEIQDVGNGFDLPEDFKRERFRPLELNAYRGLNCDEVLAGATVG